MDRDTTKIIAAVTIGLGLATMAYRASQPSKKRNRGTWRSKKDADHYDYVIIGGDVLVKWSDRESTKSLTPVRVY